MKKAVSILLILVLILTNVSALAISSKSVGTKQAELGSDGKYYHEGGEIESNSWYYTYAIDPPTKVEADAIDNKVSLSWTSVTSAYSYCVYEKIGGRWSYIKTEYVADCKLTASDGSHRYGVSVVRKSGSNYYESKYLTYVDVVVLNGSDQPGPGDVVETLYFSGTTDKTYNLTVYENTCLKINTDSLTWFTTKGAIVMPDKVGSIYFTSLGNSFYYKPSMHISGTDTLLIGTYNYSSGTYGGTPCYALENRRAFFTLIVTVKQGNAPVPEEEEEDIPVSGIKLNASKVTLTRTSKKKAPTYLLEATVAPEDATNKKLNWSSSNADVATVDKNGKVKAVSAGTCVITCKATDGSGVKAKCKVTVKDKKVTSIALKKTKATLKVGVTFDLVVKSIKPADALNKKVKWVSSNKKIATVDKNGKVTAKKKGKCIITCVAADGSKVYAECAITVKK